MSNQNNEYYGDNQDGYDSQIDSQGDDADGTNKGGKRRSKNDNAGRDFKCKYCDKTYLSYPALYTHMKQKHSKGPDGELRNPPTSGRGRGRPRKNPYQRLDPRTEDFFKAPEREGGPVDPLICFQEIYSTIFSYQQNLDATQLTQKMKDYPIYKHLVQFSNLIDENGNLQQVVEESPAIGNGGRPDMQNARNEDDAGDDNGSQKSANEHEGGDSESLNAFEGGDGDKDDNNNQPNNANGQGAGDQMQNEVKQKVIPAQLGGGNPMVMNGMQAPQQNSNANHQPSLSTLPASANPTKWQRNYDNLTDKDRQEMLVDEIFALYLYRMSNRINQNYYKTVLAYVIFFRECLNEYGWGKKIESEGIRLEGNPVLKIDIETKQFCLVNNAEHAPEICNEFVTVYMEYKKNIFDIPKHDQIDLTINLCHWLFECQFTCSKLTMIA